ncbi:MAG: argininosuccinate lyase [Chloroflexi bacterium]|nr:argininosuccinate lyase [Chloroflexota bacterium]
MAQKDAASSSKLWGGRFAEDPDPQMRALNDSIRFDRRLYYQDITASMAYARALARAGVIQSDEADQLERGLTAVLAEFEGGLFAVAEGDEDIHTAVERRLSELVGDIAGKLHTGRSRNDQVATDLRLWLREAFATIAALVVDLQRTLIGQAEANLETIMPGYTHLQPAQPITAAHWLMSFFWMLQRDHERLAAFGHRGNLSPLGSSALAGIPYPLDRAALAADMGFDGVTRNSLDAVSDRDSVAEFLFAASLLGVHLSRLAEDVILYSNPAFGFIELPDAYSTGSSLMPQKRNADPMELARGKTGRVIGHLTGLLTTLKGLPSGYNKDLQEDKEPLFDTYDTLTTLLPVVAGMVRTMQLVPDRMRAALQPAMLATELADWLVMAKGVPFRQAHHLVGEVVRVAEEHGVSLEALSLDLYHSVSSHFDSSVYGVLDFDAAVARRTASGGTSPVAVAAQIEQARKLLPEA